MHYTNKLEKILPLSRQLPSWLCVRFVNPELRWRYGDFAMHVEISVVLCDEIHIVML